MPSHVFAILTPGWVAWAIPFFLRARGPAAQTIDRRARWGIVLQAVGFAIVWQKRLWIASPGAVRLALGGVALAVGALLSWTGTLALGRQWRFDAGLNSDHQLVQSGAYRVVRHPIYTSMLCMLVGSALMLARPLLAALAIVFFITGTEIRVRVEDRLLAGRFGAAFEDYRRRVHAYLPRINRLR